MYPRPNPNEPHVRSTVSGLFDTRVPFHNVYYEGRLVCHALGPATASAVIRELNLSRLLKQVREDI